MKLHALLRHADDLGLGRIEWIARDGGWSCHSPKLRLPHFPVGATPVAALDQLVRFARRVL